ncbi:phosphoribosylaminoimidazole synthetase [Clostridium sp. 'deep sea']|uniref:phosphoribosylaminoimidazole synthetase n=1 Tax=Clostridium sp. 'deep sea' TaxID=2779445 RepID=UPI0018967C5C|nr:phosphoribosylaminoimidazole synthetase [Clostridium sp. 'deep sea']QOR35927.1 phosphoribosylaminoimidazole synthetase [Clostridium sp. 'deep sea']
MKIKCKEVEGYQFSRKDVREGITNRVTHRAITQEKSYIVYGMAICQEGLDYLIYDDYEMPMWYSADLFEIEDSSLPNYWHHSFWGYEEFGITAVWGYPELANSQKHFDGLSEQNEEDVALFKKRKKDIDEAI